MIGSSFFYLRDELGMRGTLHCSLLFLCTPRPISSLFMPLPSPFSSSEREFDFFEIEQMANVSLQRFISLP